MRPGTASMQQSPTVIRGDDFRKTHTFYVTFQAFCPSLRPAHRHNNHDHLTRLGLSRERPHWAWQALEMSQSRVNATSAPES